MLRRLRPLTSAGFIATALFIALAPATAAADEDDHDCCIGSTGWMWWSLATDVGIDVGGALTIAGADPTVGALVGTAFSLAGIGLGAIADANDWSRLPATALHMGLWAGGSLFTTAYSLTGEVDPWWVAASVGTAALMTSLAALAIDEGESLPVAWGGPVIFGGTGLLLSAFFYLLADGYGEEPPNPREFLALPAAFTLLGTAVAILTAAATDEPWNPFSEAPCPRPAPTHALRAPRYF